MIKPILIHNSCTWAAPKAVLEKVEACRRKHLREILNIRYPETIKNDELYKRTKTTLLASTIDKMRWRTFGKILRLPENKPAQCALSFAVENTKHFKKRRGRPPINLLDNLIKDAKDRNIKLDNIEDLQVLRLKAKEENDWNQM